VLLGTDDFEGLSVGKGGVGELVGFGVGDWLGLDEGWRRRRVLNKSISERMISTEIHKVKHQNDTALTAFVGDWEGLAVGLEEGETEGCKMMNRVKRLRGAHIM